MQAIREGVPKGKQCALRSALPFGELFAPLGRVAYCFETPSQVRFYFSSMSFLILKKMSVFSKIPVKFSEPGPKA